MILRVACDTNVLVSAFIAAGPPSRILEETIDGRIELVLPLPVAAELERILIQKIGFETERCQAVQQLIMDLAAEVVEAPEGRPEEISGDPADDLILACAVEAGVEVLVSGDRRHLLPLGEYRGVRIITPQALLAELRGG